MAKSANGKPKIVIFACNWEAYRGLDELGRARRDYPAQVRIVRLPCLARLHPGLVIKAFQVGADGVLILGCPPDKCHFGVGGDSAQEMFEQSRALAHLLGRAPWCLALDWVPDGRGDVCAERIDTFVQSLTERTGEIAE